MSDTTKTLANILVSGMIYINKFAPVFHFSVHLNLSYDFRRLTLLESYRFDESKWIKAMEPEAHSIIYKNTVGW